MTRLVDVIAYNGKHMTVNAEKVMAFRQTVRIDEAGGPILEITMATGDGSEEWLVKEVLDVFRRKMESA